MAAETNAIFSEITHVKRCACPKRGPVYFPAMRKPRKYGASAYIGLAHHRIDPDILRSRMRERDQRAASDDRSEIEKMFGDPPPSRSALAQDGSQQTPRRNAGQRVDLWKR